MKTRSYASVFGLLLGVLIINGCSSMALYDFARGGEIGLIKPFALIIGLGIMWYCWVEAKRKNRNPWIWLLSGFLFGLIGLLVLVYLKDLPAAKADHPPN